MGEEYLRHWWCGEPLAKNNALWICIQGTILGNISWYGMLMVFKILLNSYGDGWEEKCPYSISFIYQLYVYLLNH